MGLIYIAIGVIGVLLLLAAAFLWWVAKHAERPEDESERSKPARRIEDDWKGRG